MYQSLIWSAVLRDNPRRLCPAGDAEDREGLADSLVDRVRRDSELGGDFLGIQMLVDEAEAVELALGQVPDPFGERIVKRALRRPSALRPIVRFFQGSPHCAQHYATPEPRLSNRPLGHPRRFRQIFSGFPPIWVNPH
jgi:hypothetical protein